CHADENGPLACPTCHGSGARAYPPRDPCFFPGDTGGAHAAHVEGADVRAPIPCATCHAVPGADVIGGTHGNGSVDVDFDAGPEASWDRVSKACAVSCHDQGGARPRPAWTETGPMKCGDCHGAPPARHYPGACSTCHAEASSDGTSLARGAL